jgi:hypothetical protein
MFGLSKCRCGSYDLGSTSSASSPADRSKTCGTSACIAAPYQGLSDLEYPFLDRTITGTCCGSICVGRRKINLSTVFAGQNVGIKEFSDKIWLVSFMHYDLGVL